MHTPQDFDYILPQSAIAHHPAKPRDSSKLLLVSRSQQTLTDSVFANLESLLSENDVLVLNNTKVIPARLIGKKTTGGQTEILLISKNTPTSFKAMTKGLKIGQKIVFNKNLTGTAINKDTQTGYMDILFDLQGNNSLTTIEKAMEHHGLTPTPPYIKSSLSEKSLRRHYQTIYAAHPGSSAAPTAGLHFTPQLLSKMKANGVQIETVTLHVGPGTFAKLRPEQLHSKTLHPEQYHIDLETAMRINQAKESGKRIIAVGTTTARTLESAASTKRLLDPKKLTGTTSLFITPNDRFQVVDALITNFHLPKSSLLMLVSAFSTHPNSPFPFTDFASSLMGKAYAHALSHNYRFFSFGDAMLIE
jgi:S-adenosylmethionine:tRNA ribosyltransferase-isomerase